MVNENEMRSVGYGTSFLYGFHGFGGGHDMFHHIATPYGCVVHQLIKIRKLDTVFLGLQLPAGEIEN